MQVLYHGNYDVKTNTSRFVCREPEVLNKLSLKPPTAFTSQILYADSLANGSDKMFYVLLSLFPDDDMARCVACSPVFKFIVFKKAGNIWSQTSENITDGVGQMGKADSFQIKRFGKSIGFLFDGTYYNMGEGGDSFFLYTYYNDALRVVLKIYGASNSFTKADAPDFNYKFGDYAYNGKLQFLNTGKDFNDILLTKKGTDLRNGKVIKIDSAITYSFVNGQYVR